MDPASIAGLVVTVGQIISLLNSYGKIASGFKEDVKTLLQEAFALKGVLESLEDLWQHRQKQSDLGLEAEMKTMLEITRDTLKIIEKRLSASSGRLGTAKRALSWPFVKADFDRYMALLERTKTWFIASMMNDSSRLTQKIYADVTKLAETVRQDMEERSEYRLAEQVQAIIRQIAPILPDNDFAKFNQLRIPGTGRWFFNRVFRNWQGGLGPPLIWSAGKCRLYLTASLFYV
jgi:hypothetical protein